MYLCEGKIETYWTLLNASNNTQLSLKSLAHHTHKVQFRHNEKIFLLSGVFKGVVWRVIRNKKKFIKVDIITVQLVVSLIIDDDEREILTLVWVIVELFGEIGWILVNCYNLS